MTESELRKIADYIDEVVHSLHEWDCRGSAAERELTNLHDVIKRLMDVSAAEDDENMRVLYATVESAARKARQCILRRGGMKN